MQWFSIWGFSYKEVHSNVYQEAKKSVTDPRNLHRNCQLLRNCSATNTNANVGMNDLLGKSLKASIDQENTQSGRHLTDIQSKQYAFHPHNQTTRR